jgi:uncharacterized protein YgiM (DUF1202 family)
MKHATGSRALDILLHAAVIRRRAAVLAAIPLLAPLALAMMLTGCSALRAGGWFGGEATPTPAPDVAEEAPRVYYAAVDGLKVFSEASASSKVVGTLNLHEKVTRTRLERGYAYVESSKSRKKGWVDNAKLAWRLPAPQKATPAQPGAPAQGEAEPRPAAPADEEPPAAQAPAAPTALEEAPPESAPPEEAAPPAQPPAASAPVPAAPATPKPTPHGVAPSIFDAY